MTVPDFMPVLSAGAHVHPVEGACLMEMVSILAGEDFSDAPACTHPVLASMARNVNDRLPDADRHLLVPLIGRLIGTADTREDELARRVLSVRLAVWCARQVLHMVHEQDRGVCVAAVEAAERWTEKLSEGNAAASYAASYAAARAAAYAAAYAASAKELVALLTGLLNEHARLTGHEARHVSDDQLAMLTDTVGVPA